MADLQITGTLLSEGRERGRYPVKVIAPGWGSSGYYSAEALNEAAPLFEGAQMFWNHPTQTDEHERPERDLRDLAGVVTNVRYEDAHAEGAGIYGEATVFEPFRETLDEIAPHIGVSIRAGGKGHDGEAEGRGGFLVDSIDSVQSVDFVTRAGAGGKVMARFMEAARRGEDIEDKEEAREVGMELEEAERQIAEKDSRIAEVEAQLKEAEAEAARAKEALMLAECKALVESELAEAEVPDVTKERIGADAGRFMQVADGKLDADAVRKSVAEAVREEADYIGSLSGGIKVEGMGGKAAEQDYDMAGMFRAMGLSESAAEIAANGR